MHDGLVCRRGWTAQCSVRARDHGVKDVPAHITEDAPTNNGRDTRTRTPTATHVTQHSRVQHVHSVGHWIEQLHGQLQLCGRFKSGPLQEAEGERHTNKFDTTFASRQNYAKARPRTPNCP